MCPESFWSRWLPSAGGLDVTTGSVAPGEDLVIEQRALRAWPALVAQLVAQEEGVWLLRATPSVARRRSNSALPPLRGALDGLSQVEAFYKRRNADILIQVSPAHRHELLDQHLAAQGYQLTAPTLILRASLDDARLQQAVAYPVELDTRNEQGTQALEVIDGRSDAAGELVMDCIPGDIIFARAFRGDTLLGVGAGVLDDGWFGVFSMGTLPGSSPRQATRSGSLCAHSAAPMGTTRRSAQLLAPRRGGQRRAQRLYAVHGFQLSHRYHYRRPAATG